MRIAAFQFDVRRGEVAANLGAVERGLRDARERGVELVVLPEMWPTSFPESGADVDTLVNASESALERVRVLSRELGVSVAGSSFARASSSDAKPTNRLTLVERGEIVLSYDKVHLFTPTAEPEVFSAGDDAPPTVATHQARIAGLVCYDLRFPELTRVPFLDGAELIVVPAQWPVARALHFEALVRALAVHDQCFVVAANRTGRESIGRRELVLEFPGNSAVVAPSGEALALGRGEDGLISADIDLAAAREMRTRVPVARDRRPELYARWSERK